MGLDSLLGVELSLPAKAIVAFVVVLVLLGLVTWVFRRITGERAGAPSARGGRQPRLAVIDAAAVDNRRRLVLIRRDNVEHLIMIGGPTDVVVEQNIVRAVPVAPPREPPGPRAPAEPSARAPADTRSPMEGMRPVASPEIAPRVVTPRAEPADRAPRPFEPRRPAREPPREFARPPRAPTPSRGELEPPPMDVHPAPPTADANLTDMAQRLEAALRRPAAAREPPPAREAPPSEARARLQAAEPSSPTASPSAPAASPSAPTGSPSAPAPSPSPPPPAASGGTPPQAKPASAPAPAANATPDPKPARTEQNPVAQKSVLDSLEEEMASLLGRPEKKD